MLVLLHPQWGSADQVIKLEDIILAVLILGVLFLGIRTCNGYYGGPPKACLQIGDDQPKCKETNETPD